MITKKQQKQGLELMNALVNRAWESATFKDQLMKNPKTTIESFIGNKIEDDINFVVDDQTNTSMIYLNIPAVPNLDELELSEEQLEMVAGGATPALVVVAIGCAAGGVQIGQAIGELIHKLY